MKCEFQSLCLEKLDWDVALQGSHQRLWKNFVSSLMKLNNVRVPRCYFNSSFSPTNIQVHALSDASKRAYAAAVYLRSEYENGHVEVQLLCSKTRVAPIKQQTIPRLELLGATISARLVCNLLKSLPCEIEPTFWVDSTTVICWRSPGSNMFKITFKKFASLCPKLHGITVQVPKIQPNYLLVAYQGRNM